MYSIQAVSYAGPSLRQALNLSPAQLGAVFSLSLFGMMFGSFAIGPIADRMGRRGPLISLTIAFAVLTGATAFATQFWHVAALRFLDGLALGAALPNAYALAAEYSPLKSRRFTIGLLMVGYTIGGFAAGMVAGPLIQAVGWQAIFLVGCVAALATAAAAYFFLPESLQVLLTRKNGRQQAAAIVRRIAPQHLEAIGRLEPPGPPPAGASVRILLGREFRMITLGLWLLAFTLMLDVYLFMSWTPIVLNDAGMSLKAAILITAMYNLGSIFAAVSGGWMLDRYNPTAVVLGFLVIGCIAVAGMGAFIGQEVTLMVMSLLVGVGLGGALGGMNLLATTVYPTEARVTGTGWAISVGRSGSVIGPALGAAWVGAGFSGPGIYYGAIIPAVIAAGAMLFLAVNGINRR